MKIYILKEVELGESNFTKDIRTVAYCESPEAVWNYLTKDGTSQDVVSIVGHRSNDKGYLISQFESENITIKVHQEGYENPLLGYTFDDYTNTGLLGCQDCYDTFGDRLDDIFLKLHGKNRHIKLDARNLGKRYKKEEKKDLSKEEKLLSLKDELKELVENEEYEKAAVIRDKIKKLESKN